MYIYIHISANNIIFNILDILYVINVENKPFGSQH